jgi:uncharacterized protein YpmS
MLELKAIKKQLEAIAEAVSKIESNEGTAGEAIILTKGQLRKLVNKAIENYITDLRDVMMDIDPDVDTFVELELSGREIEIEIDTKGLLFEIADRIKELLEVELLSDEEITELLEDCELIEKH